MRILHFVGDEKFVPIVQRLYEEAFPGGNAYRVAHRRTEPLRFFRDDVTVRKVGASYFGSRELAEESKRFDIVVVHGMNPLFATGVSVLDPQPVVVWSAWGYDYYHLLESRVGPLMLDETREIDAAASRRRRRAQLMRPDVVARAIGDRLSMLLHNRRSYGRESLETIAPRIDVFSMTPLEADWVREALPRLRAAFHHLHYFTVEDVFQQGPAAMAGSGILLGNSATATNNHAEALRALQRNLTGERRIVAPLSYGNEFYADAIRALGSSLFGHAFVPLLAWEPIERYNERVADCGIVIMNHRRAQAWGNIAAALYKGATVYLRPENPLVRWCDSLGVTVLPFDGRPVMASTLDGGARDANRRVIGEFYARDAVIQSIRQLETFRRR